MFLFCFVCLTGGWWLVELLGCKCRVVLCAGVGLSAGLMVAYRLQYADASVWFCLFVCLACSFESVFPPLPSLTMLPFGGWWLV